MGEQFRQGGVLRLDVTQIKTQMDVLGWSRMVVGFVMKTDILIASWSRDIPYLEYCLRSISKFATGFNNVVVVVAEQEEALFRKFLHQVAVKTYKRVSDPVRWQLQAQAQKCMADDYCDADFVLMTDSDCVFTEQVSPTDYFHDGKPIMLCEDYSRLNGNPWKEPTEKALGFQVQREFMRAHGQTCPIGLFKSMRSRIELIHNCKFQDYVLAQKPTFPWFFSEHNALGAFAFNEPQWNNKFHWVDLAMQARPKAKIYQAWSHSPPDKPQDLPSGGRGTPLELYKSLGIA